MELGSSSSEPLSLRKQEQEAPSPGKQDRLGDSTSPSCLSAAMSDAEGDAQPVPSCVPRPITSKVQFMRIIRLLRVTRINVVRRTFGTTNEGRTFLFWPPFQHIRQVGHIWDLMQIRRARAEENRYLMMATMMRWHRSWNAAPRLCRVCQLWLNVGQWPDHCMRHQYFLTTTALMAQLDAAQGADATVHVADCHTGAGVPWFLIMIIFLFGVMIGYCLRGWGQSSVTIHQQVNNPPVTT